MKFEHLKYFVAIVQAGSLNKAAANLHISQPALSTVLKTIENELETQLLIRLYNGIQLTEAGKIVYEDALTIIEKEQSWKRLKYLQQNNLPEEVKVSIIPALYSAKMSLLVTTLKEKYPYITLALYKQPAYAVNRALLYDEIHIGITSSLLDEKDSAYAHFASKGLQISELYSDNLYLFVNKNHPLASKDFIVKEDLATLNFATYLDGKATIAARFSLFFKNCFYVNDINEMLTYVLTNEDMATISSSKLYKQVMSKDIKALPIKEENMNKLMYYIVHPNDSTITPAQKIIFDSLNTYFKN